MRLLYNLALVFSITLVSPTFALDVNEWAKKMADPADKGNVWYDSLNSLLYQEGKSTAFKFLKPLGSSSWSKESYFIADIMFNGRVGICRQ